MVSQINNQPQAQNAVMYWLRKDAEVRSRKHQGFTKADAPLQQARIYSREMPLAWGRFEKSWGTISEARAHGRIQNDQKLLRTGHFCLNVCSLARSAYVWGEISKDRNIREANESAFGVVAKYFINLSEGASAPLATYFRMPLRDAVHTYATTHFANDPEKQYGEPETTLIVTAGIAVTALMRLSDWRVERGRILCPPVGPVPEDYSNV